MKPSKKPVPTPVHDDKGYQKPLPLPDGGKGGKGGKVINAPAENTSTPVQSKPPTQVVDNTEVYVMDVSQYTVDSAGVRSMIATE